jgi:quinol monooxygenase YgiN
MKKYHILVQITAKPGKEKELREVLQELIAPSRAEPACHRYIAYESEQKGRFIFDEIWESEEALEVHAQTPHFQKAAALFPDLVEGTLEIEAISEIA